jgi:acyl carrier protein
MIADTFNQTPDKPGRPSDTSPPDRETVSTWVRDILSDFGALHNVSEDHSLIFDLCLDSLDVIEIGMLAEEEFGIEILDDVVQRFITVCDVVDYAFAQIVEARS